MTRLIPMVCWALGMVWAWWPQLASGFESMPDLLRDPRLVNYTLEHGYLWWIGAPLHADFWQTPLFFPQAGVTAFTDVMIGVGPLYWAWRALGAAPDTAFQLWMMLCFSLNYLAAYWLARRALGVSVAAGTLAAWLLAFGSAQVVHVWHPQLIPMFFVYVGTLAVFEIFCAEPTPRHSRRTWIAVFCACAVLQFYTAFYPIFFFGLFAAIACLVSCATRSSRARWVDVARSDGGFAVVAGLATAAAIAPLALEYLATAEALGMRPYMARFVPEPASWLLLGTDNYALGWLQREGGPFRDLAEMEHSAGVGFATATLGVSGLWWGRRRRGLWIALAAAGVLIAVSTTFGAFSFWRWIHALVPGAAAIRVPSRIPMVLAWAVALGVAWWVDDLAGRGRVGLAIAIALVCLVEQPRAAFPQTDKGALRDHVASIAAQVGDECRAFFAVYTGPAGYTREDDDAAWVQLATGRPTANGRYGNNPKRWKLQKHQSDGARPDRTRLRAELNRWLDGFGVEPDAVCWIEYPLESGST